MRVRLRAASAMQAGTSGGREAEYFGFPNQVLARRWPHPPLPLAVLGDLRSVVFELLRAREPRQPEEDVLADSDRESGKVIELSRCHVLRDCSCAGSLE